MFLDNIEIIKNSFLEFKGTGMYIALYLIAMIYIFIKEENKNIKNFFVFYSLVMFFLIIFNPIFNKLVSSIFKENIYWRMYWIIPFGITIAYAAVKFINETEKNKQIIIAIGIIFTIIISGKFIYNNENYVKVGNLYKLPDEHVQIAQIIGADNEDYKKAIVPDNMVAHIRQIDANIKLAYPRDPVTYEGNEYVTAMFLGDTKMITDLGKEHNCNYIVMNKQAPLTIDFHYFGYEKFNETASYIIYKIVKENV